MIRRGFVDLEIGQVHYRHVGSTENPTLVMLHASPGSSRQLESLMVKMAKRFHVIAPDTLGNGDSVPPEQNQPEIVDYAHATLATIDVLGIKEFKLYGTHTGARIACKIALMVPDRVDRLILDGFGLYTPKDLDKILEIYAPEMTPDQQGVYVMQAWQFCRDQMLWFPWYRRDANCRVPHDLPDEEFLYHRFIEILKALRTYHKSYRAAFRFSMSEFVPQLTCPTMITFAENDLVRSVFEDACALLPGAETALLPGTRTSEAAALTADRFIRFLNS